MGALPGPLSEVGVGAFTDVLKGCGGSPGLLGGRGCCPVLGCEPGAVRPPCGGRPALVLN